MNVCWFVPRYLDLDVAAKMTYAWWPLVVSATGTYRGNR